MVTREDVAKRAGVSVSAVSRTMNGRGYVAEDKKMAVLQAVRELGYRPNPAGGQGIGIPSQSCRRRQ